jgi:hypothetical protein
MSNAEKLAAALESLDEDGRRQVLHFVEFLVAKRQAENADLAVFEKAAGTWSGKFNREDCYDRKVLR